jgi:DNA ligase 1
MSFKPMLAGEANPSKLRYPVVASPKVDGIRATVVGGVAYTRSLKRIPNAYVDAKLSILMLTPLDGEITVGRPNAPDVYRKTVKGVMSHKGEPDFTFWVFDAYLPGERYASRLEFAVRSIRRRPFTWIQKLPHRYIFTEGELLNYEAECIIDGYEGICVRAPDGLYKTGRATTNGGELLKLKRFLDSEAEIEGTEEEMFNGNEAQRNELGRTKRSTAKAGLVGKGTMGALLVRDINSGVRFSIGTGFTAAERAEEWRVGDIVKYKYFPVGVKDAPRHPVYLGRRHRADISN